MQILRSNHQCFCLKIIHMSRLVGTCMIIYVIIVFCSVNSLTNHCPEWYNNIGHNQLAHQT